ncbi:UNVERIFIED_CONTAM: Inositol polyphosphate multikinase beta [Sesamum angustifolium]|uniref:Inositol polyphosphate multikinase n=1 Tax=Sesamum angustifolium TaxID=2727405 RepID=A0AAW2MR47_9LAMI
MLKVPAHQVAGHRADRGKLGPRVDDSGRFYKPLQGDERGAREVAFYTSFSSDTKVPDHISDSSPSFMELSLLRRPMGIQIFGTKESGFWKPEKKWIQSISTNEVRLLLKKFVSSDTSVSKPDCAFASIVYGGSKGILSQLLELKAWFEDQTSYHFFACSILMVFEKELALEVKSPCPEIKLVDFARVFEGRGIINHNFLGGSAL